MTLSQIDEIKRFITENFAPDISPEELPEDYDLLASGMISSLSLVKLVTQLGHRFNIDVDAADLRPDYFRTVTSISQFIHDQHVLAEGVAK